MSTARKIIEQTLRVLSVIPEGETMSAAQGQDALDAMNQLLAAWSALDYFVPALVTQTVTTSTSPVALTIRPSSIQDAYISANGVDVPLSILQDQEYDAIPLKTVVGLPRSIFWDRLYPVSSLYLYPVPNATYTITLRCNDRLTSIATLDTDVGLPPEYERALKYNLAIDLAPEYGFQVTPPVAALADQGMLILTLNKPSLLMQTGIKSVNTRGVPFTWIQTGS